MVQPTSEVLLQLYDQKKYKKAEKASHGFLGQARLRLQDYSDTLGTNADGE